MTILRKHCGEKGYALPLVLGITLVISLITLAIVLSVRERVGLTTELKHRTGAYLAAHSAYSRVVYHLLTSLYTGYGLDVQPGPREERAWWNLYGDPIPLQEGVTVRLKDLSGMASPITYPYLVKLLIEDICGDAKKAVSIADALDDWQDGDDLKRLNGAEAYDYKLAGYNYEPRNFYIQTLEELLLLKGFDPDLFQKIEEDIFLWGFSSRNYLTMSERLLRTLIQDEATVERILKLRATRELTPARFRTITGMVPRPGIRLFPSQWVQVTITANNNQATEQIQAVVVRTEAENAPFRVARWKR